MTIVFFYCQLFLALALLLATFDSSCNGAPALPGDGGWGVVGSASGCSRVKRQLPISDRDDSLLVQTLVGAAAATAGRCYGNRRIAAEEEAAEAAVLEWIDRELNPLRQPLLANF